MEAGAHRRQAWWHRFYPYGASKPAAAAQTCAPYPQAAISAHARPECGGWAPRKVWTSMTAQRCPRGAPRQQTNVSYSGNDDVAEISRNFAKISIFRQTSGSLATVATAQTFRFSGQAKLL